jgi:hypothetical protein
MKGEFACQIIVSNTGITTTVEPICLQKFLCGIQIFPIAEGSENFHYLRD